MLCVKFQTYVRDRLKKCTSAVTMPGGDQNCVKCWKFCLSVSNLLVGYSMLLKFNE